MFKLIPLPYALDALEPIISAKTLSFHHGKHLRGYVDNLNKQVAGTEYEGMSLEDIVRTSHGSIFNNAGQILNHNFYFKQFQAPVSTQTDEQISNSAHTLCKQIKSQWGSLATFKAEFESRGATLFGSGWVWLSAKEDGTLIITQEFGANNPIRSGQDILNTNLSPILTFDVWEHAYYLDYQNFRADHLASLWDILSFGELERRYKKLFSDY